MNSPTLPTASDAEEIPGPGLGHNNPPEVLPYDKALLDNLTHTADEFLAASDIWRKQDVTSDTMAGQLADQIGGLRKNRKATEDARKAAKKPHDDAGKAVQDAFLPLIGRYDRALEVMLKKQTAYLKAQQLIEEERKRKEREEAEAKMAEARMKEMEAANSGSIDAEIEAENAKKEAEKAMKSAAKETKVSARSASGGARSISMRKRNVVTITNIRHLFLEFQEAPEVRDVLQRLATARANSKGFEGDIPGCDIDQEEYAV